MSDNELDFLLEEKNFSAGNINENQNSEIEIRFGVSCPICKLGTFDYDGMLNLVCSNCGYYTGGCFT